MADKKSSIVPATKDDIAAYDVLADGVEETQAIIEANIGDMSGLGEFNLTRAINPSGDTGRWKIPGLGDDEEFLKEVEGIIVFHKPARAYYEKSYEDTGGGEQPDCVSRDGITGEGAPGGLCPKCPMSKFTKEDDGSTTPPACGEVKRLFILRPGEIMPTMFNAKGGNIGQVQTYLFNLSTRGRLKFNHVITKMTMEVTKYKNGRDYCKWNLSLVAPLPPEFREQMDAFHEFIEPIVASASVTGEDVVDEMQEPEF